MRVRAFSVTSHALPYSEGHPGSSGHCEIAEIHSLVTLLLVEIADTDTDTCLLSVCITDNVDLLFRKIVCMETEDIIVVSSGPCVNDSHPINVFN